MARYDGPWTALARQAVTADSDGAAISMTGVSTGQLVQVHVANDGANVVSYHGPGLTATATSGTRIAADGFTHELLMFRYDGTNAPNLYASSDSACVVTLYVSE